ncbi:hypothetical protein ACCS64_39060, partial [Rhizobium ruizarguesonis]
GGSPAIHLSYDSPVLTKAKNALSDDWPKPAIVIGMGGSIPIVGDFQKMLGMESLASRHADGTRPSNRREFSS